MERIGKGNLQAVVDRINRMTGSPIEPWSKNGDGKYHANIGNYHLSGAYGGYALHRMHNDAGGIVDVLRIGHVPKRTLYNAMHAFIAGIETASAKGE